MVLSEKITNALQGPLDAEYIRLDVDDGISGFVVSRRFEKMSTLDRQTMIDEALRHAAEPLSNAEQRQILMIAGLTPNEYELSAARIRVHDIEEFGDGSLNIVLHGSDSDAMYVRGRLLNERGVEASNPKPCPGAIGILIEFVVRGSKDNPLTKARALSILSQDPYIQLVNND